MSTPEHRAMRFPAFVLLFAVCITGAQAAVYRDTAFTFHQPDDTPFDVRLWGSEYSIAAETPDGWAVVEGANGWWYYARPADGGGITASALRVGAGDPATLGVARHLRPSPEQRQAVAEARRTKLHHDKRGRPDTPALRAATAAQMAAAPAGTSYAPPGFTTTGTRTGVTLLVRFSDRPSDVTITQAQVDAFCNGDNYTSFGNNGSIKQYYASNSMGRLTYTNIVRDYHTMSQPRSYYANPIPADGTDPIHELIVEALQAADDAGFDFRQCDANSDGYIDGVNIFYAGECPNSWAQGLWPHMSTIDWTSNDGVRTGAYQMTDMKEALSIGTFCHENGHMLCGFPDLYDYKYDSTGGAGIFCLMNSGGDGTNPTRVCGYLALAAGWRDAVDLYGAAAGSRSIGAETAPIFRYRKPGVLSEYFLIENRWTGSASGRDARLPCSGLAIWHCDQLGDRDDQRYRKNTLHQNYEVALVQADDQFDFERDPWNDGDTGDLWYQGNPASAYDGQFDDGPGSDPLANDARWWDGTASGLIVSTISRPGQTMTFSLGETAVSLTSATYSVNEGSSGITSAQIQVVRTGSRNGTARLNWTLADGTATVAGCDYQTASGTVTWASGETGTKSFTVPVLGDTMSETDETVAITVSCPDAGITVPIANATLTIVNDDAAIPAAGSLELTTYAASVTEGTGASPTMVTIPVRRRGGSIGATSVAWSATGVTAGAGVDFSPTSGVLSWANNDAADKDITISIVADSDPENDETLNVTLGTVIGGAVAPTPRQAVLTILNDDVGVRFLASTINVAEPQSGVGSASVVVQHVGAVHGTCTVGWRRLLTGTATPDLDFTLATTGTLTWTAGSPDPVLGIPIMADGETDAGETILLQLENPVGASLLPPSTATVVIGDYVPPATFGDPNGTALGGASQGGACGAGALAGLLCLGGLGLLRRRRR